MQQAFHSPDAILSNSLVAVSSRAAVALEVGASHWQQLDIACAWLLPTPGRQLLASLIAVRDVLGLGAHYKLQGLH